ncbi:unnamed protein product [Pleuronectes platessa]|uniref:Uncharacterized protein n=1 Tax=Pleuronectes platessa TaxID=8262 RepID=A0A9N7YZP0_PLEPL|nr:unnamed protein product [Pleuronectes platessa]
MSNRHSLVTGAPQLRVEESVWRMLKKMAAGREGQRGAERVLPRPRLWWGGFLARLSEHARLSQPRAGVPVPWCHMAAGTYVLKAWVINGQVSQLARCRTRGPMMSGLCPPVPTELVSVFELKTGSVQQEQESSPLTGKICPVSHHQPAVSMQQGSPAQIWHFGVASFNGPHPEMHGKFASRPLALVKCKRDPYSLSDDSTEP